MLAYVSARVPVTTTVCYVSSAALNPGGYLLRELGSCMHRERRDEMRVGGNTVSGSVITLMTSLPTQRTIRWAEYSQWQLPPLNAASHWLYSAHRAVRRVGKEVTVSPFHC